MNAFEFVLALVFLVVIVPTWIRFHYRHKAEKGSSLNAEDEQKVAELRSIAERLEDRVRTLERVLDAEAPDWRNRI